MRFTTKSALALLAVGALALSGCTSGGAEKAGADALTLLRDESAKALQTALTKTKDAKTVACTMEGTVEGEKIKSSGAVQYDSRPRAEFTTVDAKGESTLTRIVGSTIYTEVPAKERAEMDGKRWLKLDLVAVAKLAGGDESSAELLRQSSGQLRDMDPSEQVKALVSSAGLKVVGEEKIDGVDTVHYSRTQTPEEFMAQLGKRLGQEPQAKAIEALKKGGVTEIKLDVWVDEKYQPRQACTVMGKSDVTVSYKDYGKPVSVDEPAAADTADFAAMLQQLKDLAGSVPS